MIKTLDWQSDRHCGIESQASLGPIPCLRQEEIMSSQSSNELLIDFKVYGSCSLLATSRSTGNGKKCLKTVDSQKRWQQKVAQSRAETAAAYYLQYPGDWESSASIRLRCKATLTRRNWHTKKAKTRYKEKDDR